MQTSTITRRRANFGEDGGAKKKSSCGSKNGDYQNASKLNEG